VTLPQVFPLGESALTIRLGEVASVELSERSALLASTIRDEGIPGVSDVVAAVASVTVYYDELRTESGERRTANRTQQLTSLLSRFSALPLSHSPTLSLFTTHTIPVRYSGPDLDEVAERTKMSRDDVVRLHAGREYHVLAIGFLPGWGYLGPLDPALSLPRRSTPRTRIPAGSVAIAGTQTGIYPRVSPGGWHLIGTTDAVLFDPYREPPSLFRTGDRVRFVAVA